MAPESGSRTSKLPKGSFRIVDQPTYQTIENWIPFIVATMTSEQDLMPPSLTTRMAFLAPGWVVFESHRLACHKTAICKDEFVYGESNLSCNSQEDRGITSELLIVKDDRRMRL
jgi:hypothetical protein